MVELRWFRSSPTTEPCRLQWREVDYLPDESCPTELVIRDWTDVPVVVIPLEHLSESPIG